MDTRRMIGNVMLGIAALALAIQLCGMMGWIPKLLPSREMAPVVLVLLFGAFGFRRRRATGGATRT